jgi:carboxylate-amine ligase
MSCSFVDYRNYFLLWLGLLLDDGLKGRASDQTRIYDLGQVARRGLEAEAVVDRASIVLDRAPQTLKPWGFDCSTLGSFAERLACKRLPSDDIVSTFEREQSISGTLRHLSRLS